MEKTNVILESVELENFKNVKSGLINFTDNNKKLPVLGIYGQNGSGKTALVEVFNIYKNLVEGKKLGNTMVDIINKSAEFANAKFVFRFSQEEEIKLITYEFSLTLNEEDINNRFLVVEKELIRLKTNNEVSRIVLKFDRNEESFITIPKYGKQVEENIVDFTVANRITRSNSENTSFLFRKDVRLILNENTFPDQFNSLNLLSYSVRKLFIINNATQGEIYSGGALTIPFTLTSENGDVIADFSIPLSGTIDIPERELMMLEEALKELNLVLSKIINGLNVTVKIHDKKLFDQRNETLNEISLLSERDGIVLPLSQESDGIKKLISFLNVFTYAYGFENAILVVDELDSGIFEYLLGQLVEIFAENAKGQLIFTSHNLRVLEVLDRKMVVFSTVNPMKRYITLKGVKKTNNLRDVYLREMSVSEQIEPLYEASSSFALRRSLDHASQLTSDLERIFK